MICQIDPDSRGVVDLKPRRAQASEDLAMRFGRARPGLLHKRLDDDGLDLSRDAHLDSAGERADGQFRAPA
jgi:hypothetical protein